MLSVWWFTRPFVVYGGQVPPEQMDETYQDENIVLVKLTNPM
jgi:hypothetical protein